MFKNPKAAWPRGNTKRSAAAMPSVTSPDMPVTINWRAICGLALGGGAGVPALQQRLEACSKALAACDALCIMRLIDRRFYSFAAQ